MANKRQARPVRAKSKSNSEVLDGDAEDRNGKKSGVHREILDGLDEGCKKSTGLDESYQDDKKDHSDCGPQSSVLSRSEDFSECSAPEDVASHPESVKSRPTKKRKRPPDPNTWSSDDEDKDHKPSFLRLTAKGGYAHTSKSKLRISKANKGNTPWNKGKNRSDSVKAKIRAGVQARNRAVLLEKLKVLGMTEDEWNAKKKEIKYLRERLRRAKLANNKFKAAFEEQKLKEALNVTKVSKEDDKKIKASVGEQRQNDVSDGRKVKGLEKQEVDKLPAGFSREINWQPLEIESSEQSDAYGWKCPKNGPGGLICCEVCSAAYSKYLTQTTRVIETQKASNLGYEVKELLGFLSEAKKKLTIASDAAKLKAPPPTTQAAQLSNGTRKAGRKLPANVNGFEDFDWDVTNAMDIGMEPNTAKL